MSQAGPGLTSNDPVLPLNWSTDLHTRVLFPSHPSWLNQDLTNPGLNEFSSVHMFTWLIQVCIVDSWYKRKPIDFAKDELQDVVGVKKTNYQKKRKSNKLEWIRKVICLNPHQAQFGDDLCKQFVSTRRDQERDTLPVSSRLNTAFPFRKYRWIFIFAVFGTFEDNSISKSNSL